MKGIVSLDATPLETINDTTTVEQLAAQSHAYIEESRRLIREGYVIDNLEPLSTVMLGMQEKLQDMTPEALTPLQPQLEEVYGSLEALTKEMEAQHAEYKRQIQELPATTEASRAYVAADNLGEGSG